MLHLEMSGQGLYPELTDLSATVEMANSSQDETMPDPSASAGDENDGA